MIVLVPIVFGVPAMFVFIPPLMALAPTSFAGLVQFAALVIGLTAVASVTHNGLVQLMLSVNDTPLASVEVFCMNAWNRSEKEKRRQEGSRE